MGGLVHIRLRAGRGMNAACCKQASKVHGCFPQIRSMGLAAKVGGTEADTIRPIVSSYCITLKYNPSPITFLSTEIIHTSGSA